MRSPMKHISSLLTHWADKSCRSDEDRYDILINKIVRYQDLLFSFNNVPFASKYGGLRSKDCWGTKMVCFTDIPLSMSVDHCDKYSKFGISFRKAPLANCCVCPVAYAINPSISQAYSYLYHSADGLKALVDDKIMPEGVYAGRKFSFDSYMQNLNHFLAWMQDHSPEEFTYNEGSLVATEKQDVFFSDRSSYYYEREWRAIYRDGDRFAWVKERDNSVYFHFDKTSVQHIICPEAYCKRARNDIAVVFAGPKPEVIAFEELTTGKWDV